MYISGPREDHSVEFLLVGKKSIKRAKNFFVVTDKGDWVKIKFHFFWKDHKNEMKFFLMLQHSQINFCSFLRKNELDWLGKCSLSFKILSLVWFWRKLKCVHHKHPSQYIISRFNYFFLCGFGIITIRTYYFLQ